MAIYYGLTFFAVKRTIRRMQYSSLIWIESLKCFKRQQLDLPLPRKMTQFLDSYARGWNGSVMAHFSVSLSREVVLIFAGSLLDTLELARGEFASNFCALPHSLLS
eukprot:scaffold7596_cov72-Skeletonema_marinoi.AAC.1